MQYHIANCLNTVNREIQRVLVLYILLVAFLLGDVVFAAVLELPNARSACGPSAAFFDGRVYVGWRGSGSPGAKEDDPQLYLAFKSNESWSSPRKLDAKSMFGPVLAASRDQLFIAWHGEGNLFTGTGDFRLYFASLGRDGQVHHYGAVPGAKSAGPPGLAVHNGRVFLGWRNQGNITVGMVPGNQHWINYNVFDPRTGAWGDAGDQGINIVHANGTSGPTFAPVGDSVYALWRGTGSITFFGPNSQPGDPFIYYGFYNGEAWSTIQLPLPIIPDALTAWSPGAVEWGGKLLVGWRGDQPRGNIMGDPALSFAQLGEKDQWRPIKLFGDSRPGSAFAPAMVVDDTNQLWVFWRGVFDRVYGVDDQQIYTATFTTLP